MQIFSADATTFSKSFRIVLAPENMKKIPSKVAQNQPRPFFYVISWDGDISWTMTSRGHYFSKWATSRGQFQRVTFRGHFW